MDSSSFSRVAITLFLASGITRHEAQALMDARGFERDHLGGVLQAAGDFDHDGFPDLLVAADQTSKDPSRPTFAHGAVGIVSGRTRDLLFLVTGDDYEARTGQPAGFGFGLDAGMVGDLDQDGVCDVLVVRGNQRIRRWVVVFSGRTGAVLFELADPERRTNFGATIQGLGDVLDASGALAPDGFPDFAIGAPSQTVSSGVPTYPGKVYFYSGANPAAGPVLTAVGVYPRISYGQSMALMDDIDGDGFPALAVGAPGGEYVEVLDGPGFAPVLFLPTPFLFGGLFGLSVANVGDVNGDGAADLAVGVPDAANVRGRVVVYSLPATGAMEIARLEARDAAPGTVFGSNIAGMPVDPMNGRGLLDLDHDGTPDPFLDWNRDGKADYLIGANGADTVAGERAGGGIFLVRGSGATFESVEEPIRPGSSSPFVYSYLPDMLPTPDLWFGSRMVLLGNPVGESQTRIAVGTPRFDMYSGHVSVLRPPLAHFDDDTFSRTFDVVGTSRRFEIDFGPRQAGRRYFLLASSSGTFPGQAVQEFTLPLNDDGPGGLWERTTSLQADGMPLRFSQLTGVLDSQGKATIVIEVTASAIGHPWFAAPRQFYLPVLTSQGNPYDLAQMSAPVPLYITN